MHDDTFCVFCHLSRVFFSPEDIFTYSRNIQRLLFCLVSLENIQTDVQDLTRGLDNAKKELVIRQTMKVRNVRGMIYPIQSFLYSKNVETRPLEEFLNIAQAKVDRLIKDAKSAQESFNQCVEYFGM